MPYCKKCGAELPEDASFCPKCGRPLGEAQKKPVETHKILKVKGKPKLIITNIAPGSIEVKKGPAGEVTVDFDLKFPEDLTWNIVQDGNVVTVTCRSRISDFLRWTKYIFSRTMANISVSVPAEADLNLENRAGQVSVIGVKGTIEIDSSAGTIDMNDCKGKIKVRTRAGSVNLVNMNGTVDARSSAGSLDFVGVLSQGENWFRTGVGSIDITLMGEPDLSVEASATLGKVTFSPELIGARHDVDRHTGRIGAGNGRLIVETKTGSIIIRQARKSGDK